ncbi:EAL domain-containing protein [Sphaerochaeta pleomorpha str. Grapes]|uniref:EAL domain-containing protein n=1 Tax=Sphaerochaeta pleomorpha (strain ATCC BAA-1885 / DSM 22778 / Grapes) TaxID=158190 RepID=G8QRV1_SPHPG|nr:GGDEF domain-containing phosphodiesterase [Sphaerochaeta pleomorpha]AEV28884.1 EAL domain-containing protein [Sphaerochaeta pleomorpha str. Grapes]
MKHKDFLESLVLHRTASMVFWQLLLICLLIVFSTWLVFVTGGLTYVFSHTMYIPILLAAFAFDVWGGFFAALGGGFLLGPLMPLDVANGSMQTSANWICRCCIFIAIGLLQGCISLYLKKHFALKRWSDTHNADTGMDNQIALIAALDSLSATHKGEELCCLGVFQVSNYDSILSTFGKEVADKCIYATSKAILQQKSNKNLVGFQIFRETLSYFYVGEFPSNEEIERKSLQFNAFPIVIDSIPYYLDIHMGSATHTIEGLDPIELLNQAQIASIAAYQEKTFYMHFQDGFEKISKRNLAIIGSVPLAIQENQCTLAFQPIVTTASDSIVGVEALLRWNSPVFGSLSPAFFIPLVENTPYIEIVQNWVLEEALKHLQTLNLIFPNLHCSINLSANTLENPKLVSFVQSLLQEKEITPGNLIFEVTETAIMNSPEQALGNLFKLKELGCKLSIDDFGTGLSSFAYLENIPADSIKIDKMFIDKIPFSEHTRCMIKGLVELCQDLGLKVVAEGVDTMEKIEYLHAIGCNYLQGFYYAKALPYEQLVSWIRDNQKTIS